LTGINVISLEQAIAAPSVSKVTDGLSATLLSAIVETVSAQMIVLLGFPE
jgi:hypothetical protein